MRVTSRATSELRETKQKWRDSVQHIGYKLCTSFCRDLDFRNTTNTDTSRTHKITTLTARPISRTYSSAPMTTFLVGVYEKTLILFANVSSDVVVSGSPGKGILKSVANGDPPMPVSRNGS
jgi:hypothetical protein